MQREDLATVVHGLSLSGRNFDDETHVNNFLSRFITGTSPIHNRSRCFRRTCRKLSPTLFLQQHVFTKSLMGRPRSIKEPHVNSRPRQDVNPLAASIMATSAIYLPTFKLRTNNNRRCIRVNLFTEQVEDLFGQERR